MIARSLFIRATTCLFLPLLALTLGVAASAKEGDKKAAAKAKPDPLTPSAVTEIRKQLESSKLAWTNDPVLDELTLGVSLTAEELEQAKGTQEGFRIQGLREEVEARRKRRIEHLCQAFEARLKAQDFSPYGEELTRVLSAKGLAAAEDYVRTRAGGHIPGDSEEIRTRNARSFLLGVELLHLGHLHYSQEDFYMSFGESGQPKGADWSESFWRWHLDQNVERELRYWMLRARAARPEAIAAAAAPKADPRDLPEGNSRKSPGREAQTAFMQIRRTAFENVTGIENALKSYDTEMLRKLLAEAKARYAFLEEVWKTAAPGPPTPVIFPAVKPQ